MPSLAKGDRLRVGGPLSFKIFIRGNGSLPGLTAGEEAAAKLSRFYRDPS